MSLADPLATASFADLLRLADTGFRLRFHSEGSRGGGGPLYAELAPPDWTADPVTVPMEHSEAEGIMALINSRGGGLRSILLYNHKMPYPSSDPTGSIFGAATPIVGTITDRSHVAFTGFPINYVIPLGTYFQVIFGSTRYYLGQFAEAKTASGAGAVSAVEIVPPLPASVAPGDAVTVLKPSGKFLIVPNTAHPQTISTVHTTVSFSAEQTYVA